MGYKGLHQGVRDLDADTSTLEIILRNLDAKVETAEDDIEAVRGLGSGIPYMLKELIISEPSYFEYWGVRIEEVEQAGNALYKTCLKLVGDFTRDEGFRGAKH